MANPAELLQRAKEIIQKHCGADGYCALTLMDPDGCPNTTTITPSKAEGLKWMTFCTGYGTRTERIHYSPNACVCFNSGVPMYHISLKGRMEVLTDDQTKKEMWYPALSAHFSGWDDPNYIVLKFTAVSYTIFIDGDTLRGVIE